MRNKVRRFLGDLLGPGAPSVPTKTLTLLGAPGVGPIPPEFTPHQYLVFLLHVAAEIEHSLMVQYLYAGYSLGGPDAGDHQTDVLKWRETILGIAKEEMGHLITVQNLLRCLGGPLNLDREDYPWDSELYPFAFSLEPLTRQSLAKYVYAESPSPATWTGAEADEIKELATEESGGKAIHRVGELFDTMLKLTGSSLIKDSCFRDSTFPFQANWDEWGRGYQAGARGNVTGGVIGGTPDVIVLPVTSRTETLEALQRVATQGEANSNDDDNAPSHFARFLRIFRDFPKGDKAWTPTRNVAINPFVSTSPPAPGDSPDRIIHPAGVLWGHLFNIRYRLLLTNLMHCFEYPNNVVPSSESSPRGLLIHATFGEMYNIRAISHILMETPLTEAQGREKTPKMAGPPFQLPYTLKLPSDPEDRWVLHRELLLQSRTLANEIEQLTGNQHGAYTQMLKQTDVRMINSIESILRSRAARG